MAFDGPLKCPFAQKTNHTSDPYLYHEYFIGTVYTAATMFFLNTRNDNRSFCPLINLCCNLHLNMFHLCGFVDITDKQ